MWFKRSISQIFASPSSGDQSRAAARKELARHLGFSLSDKDPNIVVPAGFPTDSSFLDYWLESLTKKVDYSNRRDRYRTYDIMESFSGEVSLMLDTYTDEALGVSFSDNILDIETSSPEVTNYVVSVLHKNDFFRNLRSIVRCMCKYGDALVYVVSPLEFASSTIPEFLRRLDMEKLLKGSGEEVPFIVTVRPESWEIESSFLGKALLYRIREIDGRNVDLAVSPLDAVQFTIADDRTLPYGMSIIEPLRVVADQLATLEALMALSRASRVERIVIKVPVPNNNPAAALSQLARFRAMWKNAIFSETSGGSPRPYNKVASLTDVLFVPALEGFSVDAIRPSIDVAQTSDVEYFVEKLLNLTGLPKGYFLSDNTTSRGYALQVQDLKFSRKLLPIQNALLAGMIKLVYVVASRGNFPIADLEVKVSLNIPMQLSDDLISRYQNIFSTAKSIMDTYFGEDSMEDEAVRNKVKEVLNIMLKYLGAPDDLLTVLRSTDISKSDEEGGGEGGLDSGDGGDFGGGAEDFGPEPKSVSRRGKRSDSRGGKRKKFLFESLSEEDLKKLFYTKRISLDSRELKEVAIMKEMASKNWRPFVLREKRS